MCLERMKTTSLPRKLLQTLAFMGNTAKGLIYIIVGLLALGTAIGLSREEADSDSALDQIHESPFGQITLILVAVAFLAYFVWRLFESWLDPQEEGKGLSGLFLRFSYALSGAFYLTLGGAALSLAIGLGGGGGGDQTEDAVSQLMSFPWGAWLVGALGLGVLAFSVAQFYEGFSLRFLKRIAEAGLSDGMKGVICWLGRIGIVSRGVIFSVVAVLILVAAISYDPERAGGMSEAFETLMEQPYGRWLLGVVAIGLTVYGAFCVCLGRFRNVGQSSDETA